MRVFINNKTRDDVKPMVGGSLEETAEHKTSSKISVSMPTGAEEIKECDYIKLTDFDTSAECENNSQTFEIGTGINQTAPVPFNDGEKIGIKISPPKNLVVNGNFEDGLSGWEKSPWIYASSGPIEDPKTSVEFNPLDFVTGINVSQPMNFVFGHEYYMSAKCYVDSYSGNGNIYFKGGCGVVQFDKAALKVWQTKSAIMTCPNSPAKMISAGFDSFSETDIYFTQLYILDLTALYGSNIPTQAELDNYIKNSEVVSGPLSFTATGKNLVDVKNGLSSVVGTGTANQILTNGNFASTSGFGTDADRTLSTVNNVMTVTTMTNGAALDVNLYKYSLLTALHRYYVKTRVRVNSIANLINIEICCNGDVKDDFITIPASQITADAWIDISAIKDISANSTGTVSVRAIYSSKLVSGTTLQISPIVFIDMGTSASSKSFYNCTASQMFDLIGSDYWEGEKTIGGVTCSISNNVITINGNAATNMGVVVNDTSSRVQVVPGKNYTVSNTVLSGSGTGYDNMWCLLNATSPEWVYAVNNVHPSTLVDSYVTFTATDKAINYIEIYADAGSTFDNLKLHLQIEQDGVTDWDPYVEPSNLSADTFLSSGDTFEYDGNDCRINGLTVPFTGELIARKKGQLIINTDFIYHKSITKVVFKNNTIFAGTILSLTQHDAGYSDNVDIKNFDAQIASNADFVSMVLCDMVFPVGANVTQILRGNHATDKWYNSALGIFDGLYDKRIKPEGISLGVVDDFSNAALSDTANLWGQYVDKILDSLATAAGAWWEITPDKTFNMRAAGNRDAAPLTLDNSAPAYDLSVTRDAYTLYSAVRVIGSKEGRGARLVESFTPTADTQTITLSHKISSIDNNAFRCADYGTMFGHAAGALHLIDSSSGYSDAFAVGVKGIDDDNDSYPILFSYGSNTLEAKNGYAFTSAYKFEFAYCPVAPVVTRIVDDDLVDEIQLQRGGSGIVEYILSDDTITDFNAAAAAGTAFLAANAKRAKTIKFKTQITGFKVGQILQGDISYYGISGSYQINKVTASVLSADVWEYEIEASTVTYRDPLVSLQGVQRTVFKLGANDAVISAGISAGCDIGIDTTLTLQSVQPQTWADFETTYTDWASLERFYSDWEAIEKFVTGAVITGQYLTDAGRARIVEALACPGNYGKSLYASAKIKLYADDVLVATLTPFGNALATATAAVNAFYLYSNNTAQTLTKVDIYSPDDVLIQSISLNYAKDANVDLTITKIDEVI